MRVGDDHLANWRQTWYAAEIIASRICQETRERARNDSKYQIITSEALTALGNSPSPTTLLVYQSEKATYREQLRLTATLMQERDTALAAADAAASTFFAIKAFLDGAEAMHGLGLDPMVLLTSSATVEGVNDDAAAHG